jgi:hypothetical protein
VSGTPELGADPNAIALLQQQQTRTTNPREKYRTQVSFMRES